ncbi:hypothetical protein NC651_029820 [Populus alba x Populus x berolinensis]|nr:hypothetical protein NC651_029812 [Populus alba x Populus x berolinensis]KAJ6876919.1 hypothetical protein NC651_029820 [Populus alba x Populus x berolinensis]
MEYLEFASNHLLQYPPSFCRDRFEASVKSYLVSKTYPAALLLPGESLTLGLEQRQLLVNVIVTQTVL